jgi:hypothetical protein
VIDDELRLGILDVLGAEGALGAVAGRAESSQIKSVTKRKLDVGIPNGQKFTIVKDLLGNGLDDFGILDWLFNVTIVYKDGYMIFLHKDSPDPKFSSTTVSPVCGLMEINVLLKVKDGMCHSVVLVARRLEGSGTMQPNSVLKRKAIHDVMGAKTNMMLLKVFLEKKNHGWLSIDDPDDQAKIKDRVDDLLSLEMIKRTTPLVLRDRVVTIDLDHPLNTSAMKSRRNLLGLASNQMKTPLDIHRRSQSLYPNPITRKTGSNKDLDWKAATIDLLKTPRKMTPLIVKLVDEALLVPVCSITFVDGVNVFGIYESDVKIFVGGLDVPCAHDGGVVIYKIRKTRGEEWEIKRQVRVLTMTRARDEDVQPRSRTLRFSYRKPTYPIPVDNLPKQWKYLTGKEKFQAQTEILQSLNPNEPSIDMHFCVSALTALGTVDSSASMFDRIISMCLSVLLI